MLKPAADDGHNIPEARLIALTSGSGRMAANGNRIDRRIRSQFLHLTVIQKSANEVARLVSALKRLLGEPRATSADGRAGADRR